MTDGQYFYLVAVAVFLAACAVEHAWKRHRKDDTK